MRFKRLTMCKKIVPFETCGFNNCTYEFIGQKFQKEEIVPIKVLKEVGNEYLRYDPTEESVVE